MIRRRTGRSREGTIAAILFWLGVGVAANVLATWGIAVWQAGVEETLRVRATVGTKMYERSFGTKGNEVPQDVWTGRPTHLSYDDYYLRMSSNTVLRHHCYGVPWRSLECRQVEAESRGVWRYTVELPIPAGANGATSARLPLLPIWPGFALNTLFYAAIAWGLWQLPLALRRRSRSKKGLCVRCGYDLKGLAAGSACPECGSVPRGRG